MNAQCFWLSSQSGQTQITVGQNHWCCAGGRRWCCAGSPSALMVLLCVWCVVGIGARAHHERDREVHTAAPRVRPHARACAHTRSRHRRGVGERPHVRWSVERTASLAVAKQGDLGELSGLCKVYRPKRRPAEGAVIFRPIMWLYSASVVLGSTLHLALAIFQQGIPCFGHCPFLFVWMPSIRTYTCARNAPRRAEGSLRR